MKRKYEVVLLAVFLVLALTTLVSCAMKPEDQRAAIDACTENGLKAHVEMNEKKGKVTAIRCYPVADENVAVSVPQLPEKLKEELLEVTKNGRNSTGEE